MKKWIGFGFLAIIVIGLGSAAYIFFIKDYETADAQVDEIVETSFTINLPKSKELEERREREKNSPEATLPAEQQEEKHSQKTALPVEQQEEKHSQETSLSEELEEENNSQVTSSPKEQKQHDSDIKEEPQQVSASKEKENSSTSNDKPSTSKSNHNQSSTSNHKKPATPEENKNDSETSKEKETPGSKTQLTVTEIENRYAPSFQSLQDQANAKINNLVEYAYQEYQKKKETDKSVSYGYFYTKYKSAANRLEESTDVVFNQLYDSLKKELQENGHPKNALAEVKSYYNEQKEVREKALIKKALDNF
ncbi:hypothetical protein [Pontibacillus salipaludis]|uniref:hypothetical protein n=1 Tax=Pontibacillus salipaludis TaxID=1697394 RepID=UPI0031F0C619